MTLHCINRGTTPVLKIDSTHRLPKSIAPIGIGGTNSYCFGMVGKPSHIQVTWLGACKGGKAHSHPQGDLPLGVGLIVGIGELTRGYDHPPASVKGKEGWNIMKTVNGCL